MHRLARKFNAISLIFILLTTGLISQSIAFANEKTQSTEKFTIYRHGPDGTITPMQIDVSLDKEKDIQEAISKKLEEFITDDLEIQNYLSSDRGAKNISFYTSVKSWGKGLHLQSPFRFRIPFLFLLRFRLFPDVPLRYKILGLNVIPRVHCNYMNDVDAKTTLELLPTKSRPVKETVLIEGAHNVTAYGFIGYTFWRGMYARIIDGLELGTGFAGYALAVVIN